MANDHNPLSHVVDHDTLELPYFGHIELPKLEIHKFFGTEVHFQITRFMVMEVVAALLIIALIVPLSRHIAKHPVTRGRFMNLLEMFLLFVRDNVARSVIDGGDHGHDDHGSTTGDGHGHGAHGHIPTSHDPSADSAGFLGRAEGLSHARPHTPLRTSDLYMPFLWTMFFFVLINNLLGMIPGGASATGNINVTAMLALMTLVVVVMAGMKASGPAGFFVKLVPKIDVPAILKPPIWGMLFVIEIVGLLIRHIVLAVRLFANLLAGHIVLAVIVGFVGMVQGGLIYLVTPASILGAVCISMLELFVAFLQAYIFVFLASLFIGSAAHPH